MAVEEPDIREHQSSPEAEDAVTGSLSSSLSPPTSPPPLPLPTSSHSTSASASPLPRPAYHTEMTEITSILPRIDEKTLIALYPPHLKLHLVQVVHRHGHRTPLSYRLPTLIPYHWTRCFKADQATQHIVLDSASVARPVLGYGQNGTSEEGEHDGGGDSRSHGIFSDASSLTDPLELALSQTHSNQSLFSSHEPAAHMRPLASQTFQMLMENPLAPPHHLDDPLAVPRYAAGHCYYGQLTDSGRQLMTTLGAYLRTIYIQRLGFLPLSWSAATSRSLYLRSTSYPRTIETLQSVVAGLYPPSSKHPSPTASTPPIPIYLRMEESETMYPWLKCVRYRELQTQFKKTAHSLLSREMEMIKQKLKHLFNMADPFGAYPSFHGLFDTLYCSKEHGWDIKKSFDVQRKDLASLEHISVKEWFSGFEESEEVVRLGIGRFIKELTSAMETKVRATASPEPLSDPSHSRFHIYSGHDTTIAPLLCAFRVFDEKWPPFGSNMTFELLEDVRVREKSRPTEPFYVRLKTNDQVMQMPACQGYYHDSDVSLCQLDRFFEICRAMIPKNLDKECALIPELN